MDFDTFLDGAWEDHASDAQGVAVRLEQSLERALEPAQVPPLAQLVTHVFGEHLGSWRRGADLLGALGRFAASDAEARLALERGIATLELAGDGRAEALEGFGRSDQARVHAMAAAALVGRGELGRAVEYFERARASVGELPESDPAQRALAVTANNLAAELEQKAARGEQETGLMLRAARTARAQWAIAGNWRNVERADYRLARSCLAAGVLDEALGHARACLCVCRENAADPFERFYAFECLARVEAARSNSAGFAEALRAAHGAFEELAQAEQSQCRPVLDELAALEVRSERPRS